MSKLACVTSVFVEQRAKNRVFAFCPREKWGERAGKTRSSSLSLLHENACYTRCVETDNILKTELLEKNDNTIIKRLLCPSFTQTQIKLADWCLPLCFQISHDTTRRDMTGQGKACQNKQKSSQGKRRQGKSSEGKPEQADK